MWKKDTIKHIDDLSFKRNTSIG